MNILKWMKKSDKMLNMWQNDNGKKIGNEDKKSTKHFPRPRKLKSRYGTKR